MDANSIPIEQLKSEFKSRISFIHLVSSLIPEAVAKPEANGDKRSLPLYLGKLDDAQHKKIAEERVKAEAEELPGK